MSENRKIINNPERIGLNVNKDKVALRYNEKEGELVSHSVNENPLKSVHYLNEEDKENGILTFESENDTISIKVSDERDTNRLKRQLNEYGVIDGDFKVSEKENEVTLEDKGFEDIEKLRKEIDNLKNTLELKDKQLYRADLLINAHKVARERALERKAEEDKVFNWDVLKDKVKEKSIYKNTMGRIKLDTVHNIEKVERKVLGNKNVVNWQPDTESSLENRKKTVLAKKTEIKERRNAYIKSHAKVFGKVLGATTVAVGGVALAAKAPLILGGVMAAAVVGKNLGKLKSFTKATMEKSMLGLKEISSKSKEKYLEAVEQSAQNILDKKTERTKDGEELGN